MRAPFSIQRIVMLAPFLATAACAPIMQEIVTTSNQPRYGNFGVGGGSNPQGVPVRLSPSPSRVALPNDVLASRGVHLSSPLPPAPRLPARIEGFGFGAANAAIMTACTLAELMPEYTKRRAADRPECDLNQYKQLHPAVFTVPKTAILVR